MERLIKRLASQQWTERKERGEEKELAEEREERKKKGIGKTEWKRAGEETVPSTVTVFLIYGSSSFGFYVI